MFFLTVSKVIDADVYRSDFVLFQVGCPVLALEVLSKIPRVSKKCSSSALSKASSKVNVNANQPLENGTQGGMDWSTSAASSHAWGANESSGGLDWSQLAVKVKEDELKLDWEEDKDADDIEDDDGLTMKKAEPENKAGEGPKLQKEDSQVKTTKRPMQGDRGTMTGKLKCST